MYGANLTNTPLGAIQTGDDSGLAAATELTKHAIKYEAKIRAIYKAETGVVPPDIDYDMVYDILLDDLMNHDYNEFKAKHEPSDTTKPIEKYILERARYAVLNYRKIKKDKESIVYFDPIKGQMVKVYAPTLSMDHAVQKDSDKKQGTLGEKISKDYSNFEVSDNVADRFEFAIDRQIDRVNPEDIIDDLVMRITRFAEWSDTNLNVIIYITNFLELVHVDNDKRKQEILTDVLNALGLTNYGDITKYLRQPEFTEMYKDAANVVNKRLFVKKLYEQIYCGREITETIHWVVRSYKNAMRKNA